MFWKTCLTHAGEILLALGGAWILGYLWNRWFGSRTDPRQIAEYEDQIKTLRDRIKSQDQEIKASLVRQDTWNAELAELNETNSDLKNRLNTIDNSYLQYVAPAALKDIQDRHQYDIKLHQDQVAALSEQNRLLSDSAQSFEARLKAFQIQEEEFSQTQSKLQIAEAKLHETQNILTNLEHEFRELSVQQKSAEENRLLLISGDQERDNLRKAFEIQQVKNQELEAQIQQIQGNKESTEAQVNELSKKLEETRQISMELESKYIQQLQARDEAINEITARLNTSPPPDQSANENLSSKLSASREEVTSLQNKLNQLESIQSEQDSHQLQKFHDLQILNQQLTNELNEAKEELRELSGKMNNYSSLEKNVAEWTTKSKEWEARWKDAAKESEQFKVAHASLMKEKDGHQQHLAQLEADILQFNNVFRDNESKEEQWNKRMEDLQAELDKARSDYESKLALAHQSKEEVSNKLIENQDTILGMKSNQEELNKKYEDLLQNLNILQNQKEDADQTKAQQRFMLNDMEHKLKKAETELLEHKIKLAESAHLTLPAHKEAEWDHVLRTKEEELKLAQHTISELVVANENKLDKLNQVEQYIPKLEEELKSLNNELEKAIGKLNEQTNLLAERETKNEDLHNELQLVKTQLKELNQLKESQSASLGNWEQLYAESQKALATNRQQFSENEKNNQAMETLVAEWEKKYHLVQNELLDVQHQLVEMQQLQDSRNEVEANKEDGKSELEIRLEDARQQLDQFRIRQTEQHNLAEEWEKKYDELFKRFNIVQLQYADTQRIKSHLESDMRKVADYQAKYLAESKGWQKRLADIEADYKEQLAALRAQEPPLPLQDIPPTPPREQFQIVAENSPSKKVKRGKMPPMVVKLKSVRTRKSKAPPPQESITPKKPVKQKTAPAELKVMDFREASTILSKKVTENDLKIIEGIGPKISNYLKRNKISSWQALSRLPVKEIKTMLGKGGTKFVLAKPKTWPKQAKLAAEGRWARLKKFQDKLNLNNPTPKKNSVVIQKPGKTVKVSLPKKIKPKVLPKPKPIRINLAKSKTVFGKELKLNDLKVIEGVGPKIEKLLNKANILTWSKLAKTKLRPLRNLLKNAGNNFVLADPISWSAQARLASRGQWKRLKTLQDKLNNRK